MKIPNKKGLIQIDAIDHDLARLSRHIHIEDNRASVIETSSKLRVDTVINSHPRLFKVSSHSNTMKRKRVSDQELKVHYDRLTTKLNNTNPEAQATPSERNLLKLLKNKSKKQILKSVWIGTHCIDLFIPNCKLGKGVGLAIEVDGDVHNFESKMKKDERKRSQLTNLGIALIHVKNWDFKKPAFKSFIDGYSSLKALDSRERQRMWRRIHTYTLAIHLSNSDFFNIFTKHEKSVGSEDEK